MGLVLLFIAGLLAGCVDSIAGGGGLITLPALLYYGVAPQQALGTNKLQSSFGSATSCFTYARGGAVDLREMLWPVVFTAIGAAGGSALVQQLDAEVLRKCIPALLLLVFFYTLLSPELGIRVKPARLERNRFYLCFGLLLGFYDGFFGPGTGSFWTIALVMLLGQSLVSATAQTKVCNFTSNIVSLTVFLVGGNILLLEGLVMGAGQFIGARIGATLVLRRGAGFVRPIFLVVVGITGSKLAFDAWF
jgi:uncharacterized membrane protein YfcA